MVLEFIWNWISEIYSYFAGKKAKVVFLGLANAGKSTLMDLLKTGQLRQHPPTNQSRSLQMKLGDVTFTVYDVGGHKQARRIWRDYYYAVDAIVFVIDAFSQEEFAESKAELHGILADEHISDCPVLVLGNKIDIQNAASERDIISHFGLEMFVTGKEGLPVKDLPSRPLEVFMCTLRGKQGYGQAFRWLSRYIK